MIKLWCIHLLCFFTGKKKTPIVPGNEQRTHLPKKSCAANTYVFLVVFSFASDRFSTASATAAVLVVLWEEWRGGGNRAIKEAPDSGIRQQKTDLNWDLQQRGGKRRRPCGPHACLSSPASSHQPLWVSFGSSEPVRLCLYPCDVCRCGRKNTPLVFCDLRSLRLYHNFLFLLFRCQSLSDKCDESLWHLFSSVSISLLSLISSFLLSKPPETFFSLHFSYLHSVSFCDLLPIFRSVPLSLVSVSFKESLTLLWLCVAALFRIEGTAGGEKNVFCHFTHWDLKIKLQSLSFPLVSVNGNRCSSASFLFWPLVDCFKNRLNEVI